MDRRNFIKAAVAALPLSSIATSPAAGETTTYINQDAATPSENSSLESANVVYTGEFATDDAYDRLLDTHGDAYTNPETDADGSPLPGRHIGFSESGDTITDPEDAEGLMTIYDSGAYILRTSTAETLPALEQTLIQHVQEAGVTADEMLASIHPVNIVTMGELDPMPAFDSLKTGVQASDTFTVEATGEDFPAIKLPVDGKDFTPLVFVNGRVAITGAPSMAAAETVFTQLQALARDVAETDIDTETDTVAAD